AGGDRHGAAEHLPGDPLVVSAEQSGAAHTPAGLCCPGAGGGRVRLGHLVFFRTRQEHLSAARMPQEPSIYQRLPGRGSSAFEHARLYLAPDHLLLVSSTLWIE